MGASEGTGKWVGAVSLSEGCDWLACGGGVPLSAWQLRNTSQPAAVFSRDADGGRLANVQDVVYSADGVSYNWQNLRRLGGVYRLAEGG